MALNCVWMVTEMYLPFSCLPFSRLNGACQISEKSGTLLEFIYGFQINIIKKSIQLQCLSTKNRHIFLDFSHCQFVLDIFLKFSSEQLRKRKGVFYMFLFIKCELLHRRSTIAKSIFFFNDNNKISWIRFIPKSVTIILFIVKGY